MISVVCFRCRSELNQPGALLFSPPFDDAGSVVKRHLCEGCYEFVLTPPAPAEPEPEAGEALAESVLPHALFAEAMRAAECCAGCAIDVFRRQRQVIFDGEHVERAARRDRK